MTQGMRLASTVLGAPDARALASFYTAFLEWQVLDDEPDWVKIKPAGGGTGLAFQKEPHYVRPVWPAGPGDPAMMAHLDIGVDDLEEAVTRAIALGAVEAEFQPQDDVRVMLDPAGHPFCLFANP
jgi:catechol 2,3-dioxygenase-like lactoylglutathione lyase family enzyme